MPLAALSNALETGRWEGFTYSDNSSLGGVISGEKVFRKKAGVEHSTPVSTSIAASTSAFASTTSTPTTAPVLAFAPNSLPFAPTPAFASAAASIPP